MKSLITNNCEGTQYGQVRRPPPHPIDGGATRAIASSLFVQTDGRGGRVLKPKLSDDKIVLGYTPDGYPFQLVIDGFYGCDRQAVFRFVDEEIVTRIAEFATNLKASKDVEVTTKAFIYQLYALNKALGKGAEFTCSLSVVYPSNDSLRVAGFGIGDTAQVLMRHRTGELEQLAYHTEVAGFKDAFDGYCAQNPEIVIARNSVFDTEVQPGDEILGYTYVFPELEKTASIEESCPLKDSDNNDTVCIEAKCLSPTALQIHAGVSLASKPTGFFDEFLGTIETHRKLRLKAALAGGEAQKYGDDFTAGCILVPDAALAHTIRTHVLLDNIYQALNEYAAKQGKKSLIPGIFSSTSSAQAADVLQAAFKDALEAPEAGRYLLDLFLKHPKARVLLKPVSDKLEFEGDSMATHIENLLQEDCAELVTRHQRRVVMSFEDSLINGYDPEAWRALYKSISSQVEFSLEEPTPQRKRLSKDHDTSSKASQLKTFKTSNGPDGKFFTSDATLQGGRRPPIHDKAPQAASCPESSSFATKPPTDILADHLDCIDNPFFR